ncbi:MAG: hypothetical protein EOP50_09320 [Sphingobacteriales bacterium]|nr:MAG: hypothetical protein EOP50_09320 [Sphingobacteriales bacterium]
MPSRSSETGHGVNRANFDGLYEFTGVIGTAYKPANEAFKRINLKRKATECGIAFEEAERARRAFNTAVNDRADGFKGINTLSTRIMKSLRSSGASARAIADAETINKKVQGSRATPPPKAIDGAEAARARSVSQLSFDMIQSNFEKLVDQVSATPAFNPGEEELSVDVLKARATRMKELNTTVVPLEASLTETLLRRDIAFYAPGTGLVDTALGVKEYIASLDRSKVPAAAEARKFRFRNYRERLEKAGIA